MKIQDIKEFIDDDKYSHALISTSLDWADECDFMGFYIFNKEEAKELLTIVERIGEFTFCVGFGTNEANDEETIEHLLNYSDIDLLDRNEARTFKRVFPDNEFGHSIKGHLGQFYEFSEEDWKDFLCEDDEDDNENDW